MIVVRNQRGDTIVEVLIAAAIAGLILVGAFSIANASFKQIRASQERGEAQRYAQSQVEQLDAALATATPVAANFCIKSDGTPIVDTSVECKRGIDDRYSLSITHPAGTPATTYQVTVQWDGVTGITENLTLDYRIGERRTTSAP